MPSKQIQVQHLSLASGENTDFSMAVITDNQGFLWIATDHGLKRYDGYELKTFQHRTSDPSSIGNNSIRSIIFQDNQLWSAGNKLNLYHPETESFSNYNASDGYVIWSMLKQGDIIWLGGEGFGLRGFNIKSKQVTHQRLTNGDERMVYSIAKDKQSNKLWVAAGTGLYLYDPQNDHLEKYLDNADIGDDNQAIEDIVVDNFQNVWLATRQGLFRLKSQTKELIAYRASSLNLHAKQVNAAIDSYASENTLLTNTHWCLYEDRDGDIWIGTDKYGVSVYRREHDDFINIESELTKLGKSLFPPVAIYDIFQDQQGSFWFATGEGIRRLSPHLTRFNLLTNIKGERNSLGFNNVLSILEDRDGLIWIATDGGGLDSYDPATKTFKHYIHNENDPNSLSSNSVIALAEDNAGTIWAGTYNGGFNAFNKNTQTFTRYKFDKTKPRDKTLAKNDIFKIFIDKQQRVWLSVWQTGLQIFDPATGSYESYFASSENLDLGISNFSITDIEAKQEHEYWIAGYGGLEVFNTQTKLFKRINIPDLSAVFDVFPIAENRVWLSTDNGLVFYDGNTEDYQRYTEKDGLANNYAVSIGQDASGILWVGTLAGLSRFNPSTKSFRTFSQTEGLVSDEFNRFSYWQTNNGLMYFGGPEGVNIFDPNNMPVNQHIPNIIFTKFEFRKADGMKKNLLFLLSEQENLQLNANENDLHFEFAALDFIAPNKNKYQYRLLGLENTWNHTSANNREVRYTNLSPGHYRFEVKASNNEGVWTQQSRVAQFTILPAWWQTWWAYVLYALLVCLTMYGFVFWRIRTNQLRAKKLKQQVASRTEALRLSNQELELAITDLNNAQSQLVEAEKMASLGDMVAGISHEVNTPLGICLTSVSHLKEVSEKLFKKYHDKTLANKDFLQFEDDVNTGLTLSLNNIVRASELIRSFKQVAVEQTAEQVHEFNLKNILEDTIRTISPKLKKRPIRIQVDCPDNIQMVSYAGAITQVVINLVMNSLTHGFDENCTSGTISLSVSQTQNTVLIIYRDDGKGIAAHHVKKVFEPFFTTNRNKGNTGLGMHILYNLISQQLFGQIKLNESDVGVEFEINIPINIAQSDR